jgi:multisubunit Na+/H+ antiporter MnhC subunit
MLTLKPDEYRSHIALYKFALGFAFKAITIFFLLVSGVLTLGLGPDLKPDNSYNPVRSALLITSFLVNIAMILGFGVTTYLWSRLSRKVRGKVRWSTLCEKSDTTWNEFVVRLYSPSLTMILSITTALFIVFSILLGNIMAAYGVLFCDVCSLGPSRLPKLALIALVASRVVNSSLLLIKSMKQNVGEVMEPRAVDSKEVSGKNDGDEVVPKD